MGTKPTSSATSKLSEAIARTREAVLSRHYPQAGEGVAGAVPAMLSPAATPADQGAQPPERHEELRESSAGEHFPVTPRVVVRGASVQDRAAQIVTAAEECGRVHTERAHKAYKLLVCAALALLGRNGAAGRPNRVSFFMVADELPELLGVGRATAYRALDDLRAGGLVARRTWYTTGSRQDRATGERTRGTVAGGVVVDVVLTPERGTAAKVTAAELRGKFRDLDADRSTGRTAWQWKLEQGKARAEVAALEKRTAEMRADPTLMDAREFCRLEARAEELRQSLSTFQGEQAVTHLLRWALSAHFDSSPASLTVSRPLEVVYSLADLKHASRQERGALVDERARALLAAFGDRAGSLNMWRRLLWCSIFADERDPGALEALSTFLVRLVADVREWPDMRRAGAVLVARLKASGWWDHLETVRFERRATLTKLKAA